MVIKSALLGVVMTVFVHTIIECACGLYKFKYCQSLSYLIAQLMKEYFDYQDRLGTYCIHSCYRCLQKTSNTLIMRYKAK